jgi:hypothetical protein
MKLPEIFVLFAVLIFVGLICCAGAYDLGRNTERQIFLKTLKDKDLIEYVVDEELQVQWKFKND